MKKTLILTVLGFALPVFAQAATITITPTSSTVAMGQKVTLTVSVNPTGQSIAAVEAHLSYSANILAADSFAYASTWVPVTQGGYDQFGSGAIVKTAGYPSGLSSTAAFGTITFTAKAAGTATVAVDPTASITYNAQTVNVLQGAQGKATITVTSAASAGSANNSNTNSGSTVGSSSGTTGNSIVAGTISTTSSSSSATATNTAAQTAAAAAAGTFGPWWLWLLAILAAIIVVGGLWYLFRPRQ